DAATGGSQVTVEFEGDAGPTTGSNEQQTAWYNAIDSTRNGDARGLSAQIQKDPKGMS
ncbi:unnamed protein product, partial [Durusdinium trenchii]